MTMINQTVDVSSFFFKGGKELKGYPRQMEYGNRQYTFTDGLWQLVRRGRRIFELFDMTDGRTVFRMVRLGTDTGDDAGSEWWLIGTRAVDYQHAGR